MFTVLMCVVILTATPLSASVVKHVIDSCSPTEFACGDGGCISVELVCDGSRDCADGGDEIACDTGPITLGSNQTVLHRPARQASGCRRDQWTCRDGTCVSFDAKCDGIVDCSDGSDERHALCRKSQCQYNWFRCTYGACVDGTAPCNGKQECADNSDELLPRCRNETDEVRGQFKCQDGSTIPAASHCDGVADCADGSDETVRTCAAKTCHSYLFQCAYGACVDSGSDCNQSVECADGSDEAPDLCNKILPPTTPDKPQKNKCIMPAYPAHGTYVSNVAGAKPDDAYNVVNINVTCREGYGPSGPTVLLCLNGWWQSKMPECILQCQLNPHASVEYICLVTEETVTGTRPCQKYEPDGTAVSPVCRTNYYSSTALLLMRCVSGNWNYIARCSPGLTKNGTNITILIKDTVEVHVSDFQYSVPIDANNNLMPVVPITDSHYNNTHDNGINNSSLNNRDPAVTVSDYNNNTPDNGINNKPGYNNTYPAVTDGYNNNNGNEDNHNNKTAQDNMYTPVYDAITSKPYDKDNVITGDVNNEATDTKIDESDYDIDVLDWRMGVPTDKSTANNTETNKNGTANKFGSTQNNGITQNKPYTTKSNSTNIYFNISNSSVHVYADEGIVFRN